MKMSSPKTKYSKNKLSKALLIFCLIFIFLLAPGCTLSEETSRYKDTTSEPSYETESSYYDITSSTFESSGETLETTTEQSTDITNAGFDGTTLGDPTTKKVETTTKVPTTQAPTTTKAPTTTYSNPKPGAEIRGVWVSYLEVGRLISGGNAAAVKARIDSAMTTIKEAGLNTVYFHARANSDAYYSSSLFKRASGVDALLGQGLDPLEYAITSAHRLGLQLHAWVNPYRIGTKIEYAELSGNNIFKADTHYYYNPASVACQKLIIDGVAEIVSKYNVDGIQFDDYFYPNNSSVLPRNAPASFETALYNSSGGGMSISAWRISQINTLVKSVYKKVHELRSAAVFGISPDAQLSRNADLYADPKTWISQSGYVDYILPQIYFGFKNQVAPFTATLNTWVSLPRHSSVKLYIGLPLYKCGASDKYAGTGINEFLDNDNLIKQMILNVREKSECGGIAIFSYESLIADKTSIRGREIENLKSVLR